MGGARIAWGLTASIKQVGKGKRQNKCINCECIHVDKASLETVNFTTSWFYFRTWSSDNMTQRCCPLWRQSFHVAFRIKIDCTFCKWGEYERPLQHSLTHSLGGASKPVFRHFERHWSAFLLQNGWNIGPTGRGAAWGNKQLYRLLQRGSHFENGSPFMTRTPAAIILFFPKCATLTHALVPSTEGYCLSTTLKRGHAHE